MPQSVKILQEQESSLELNTGGQMMYTEEDDFKKQVAGSKDLNTFQLPNFNNRNNPLVWNEVFMESTNSQSKK